jgi:hypothetical protein
MEVMMKRNYDERKANLIEWSKKLNEAKIEYPFNAVAFSNELKRDGLIVAYGNSDDLLEFAGALDDEVGAWDGTTVSLGVLETGEVIVFNEDENRETLTFNRFQISKMKKINALWCPQNERNEVWASWHITAPDIDLSAWFDIFEDGELNCRGLIIPVECLKEE